MTPIERCWHAYANGLKPDQRVWVDEWAEANRVLPPDTPEPGPYRNSRTPYLVDIQRTMSPNSPYSEGWWQKPVQIGGSVSGENMIGSWICTAAGSILVVFPTLDDGKQWELSRFEPMRATTRDLRRRIRAADERGSDNTKLRKKFPGGVMRLVGSNRVGGLKSASYRYVKFEEPDEYVADIGATGNRSGQGSAIDMARARTKNFGRRRKIYGDGTPTLEGSSAIAEQVKRGDQRHWHLHCPDCKQAQRLMWAQLKWVDGDPTTARYACIACGTLNTEHAWKAPNYAPRNPGMSETDAQAAGLAYWEPTAQGEPGVASWVGFNALGAPVGWRPWADLVVEWIAAQGDPEKLKIFYNNILAETYTDTIRATVGADVLQQRAENYALMTSPQGALICCASVDTQDNRLAVLIRTWGRGEESWGVWHDEIYGDPALPEVWAKLKALLDSPIRHASGQTMRVDACAIDAGGHHAENVYAFCRDAQLHGKNWFAVRGAKDYYAPKLGRPKKIEFTWRGMEVPGGVQLRWIGTQMVKNLIDARLKLSKPGGGAYHFPLAFKTDYYEQLRAEKREWRRDSRGRKELWWVPAKSGARNEAWDLEVYNYACFLYCMSGQHADTVWRLREKLFGAVQQLELLNDGAPRPMQASASVDAPSPEGADEEAPNDAPAASLPTLPAWQATPAPGRRRRGSFVTRGF